MDESLPGLWKNARRNWLFGVLAEPMERAHSQKWLCRGSIEQDSDSVAGEGGSRIRVARANGGRVDFARGEAAVNVVRELAKIGGFVAHDRGGALASVAAFEFAGAAGVSRSGDFAESARGQLRSDFLFLLLDAGGRNRGREVFDGKIQIAGLHHSDANGVELTIEKIGAMRRGIHPLRVQAGNAGAFGDVFRDEAEPGASVTSAILNGRLTGELVGERISLRHEKCVVMRGCGEGVVPLERTKTGGGPIAIGGIKKREAGGTGRDRCGMKRRR